MTFEIAYFHERVLAEIESWPVDRLADYARLLELLAEHGRTFVCRIPALSVTGSLSFVLMEEKVLAERSIALSRGGGSLSFTRSLKRLGNHPTRN